MTFLSQRCCIGKGEKYCYRNTMFKNVEKVEKIHASKQKKTPSRQLRYTVASTVSFKKKVVCHDVLLGFPLLGLLPFTFPPWHSTEKLHSVFLNETYWFGNFLIPFIRQRIFLTLGPHSLKLHCDLKLTWNSKACWCVISLYLFKNCIFSRAPVTVQALWFFAD